MKIDDIIFALHFRCSQDYILSSIREFANSRKENVNLQRNKKNLKLLLSDSAISLLLVLNSILLIPSINWNFHQLADDVTKEQLLTNSITQLKEWGIEFSVGNFVAFLPGVPKIINGNMGIQGHATDVVTSTPVLNQFVLLLLIAFVLRKFELDIVPKTILSSLIFIGLNFVLPM